MTKRKQPTERIRKRHNTSEELRTIAVCTRPDGVEAAILDTLRGRIQRGVYVRMLINGIVPRKLPMINQKAYIALGNISSQLERLNINNIEVKDLIAKLRCELLGIKLEE